MRESAEGRSWALLVRIAILPSLYGSVDICTIQSSRCLRVFLVSLRLYHTQGEAPEAASQFSYTYGWEKSSVRLEHSYELFAAANSAGKTQATAPFAIEVLHVLY
jgi:hypothetical protein